MWIFFEKIGRARYGEAQSSTNVVVVHGASAGKPLSRLTAHAQAHARGRTRVAESRSRPGS